MHWYCYHQSDLSTSSRPTIEEKPNLIFLALPIFSMVTITFWILFNGTYPINQVICSLWMSKKYCFFKMLVLIQSIISSVVAPGFVLILTRFFLEFLEPFKFLTTESTTIKARKISLLPSYLISFHLTYRTLYGDWMLVSMTGSFFWFWIGALWGVSGLDSWEITKSTL